MSVTSDTLSVVGDISGSTISLSFNGGPDAFGTLAGGSFTMDFPQSDGTLSPVTFSASSAAAYNAAVRKLQDEVNLANQNEASAQAQANAEATIDQDATTVADGIASGLPYLEQTVASEVASLSNDLQYEAGDLASTLTLEQQVVAEAHQGSTSTCGDAGSDGGDAGSVGGDAQSLGGDAEGVESALNDLRDGIAGLQSDWSTFQNDSSNLPGYQPPNPPTAGQVSQAVAAANQSISAALSTTNGDIDKANADVTTAFGYAATADQAGNCGTPPPAPNPLQHIS